MKTLTIDLNKSSNFNCNDEFVIQGQIAGEWVDTIYQNVSLERLKEVARSLIENREKIGKLRIVRNKG